jgi:hypothetical protein
MKLTLEWNNSVGDYFYVFNDGTDDWRGDLNWAQRMAKHYGLKLPEIPEV